MRFAGLGGTLSKAWNLLRPKSVTEGLIDFAPDLLFAGLAGASADPGYKLGVGAEDFALGFGGSILGRAGGALVGRRLLKKPVNELTGAINIGSMATSMPLALLGPRPTMDAMFRARQEAQGAPIEPTQPGALGGTVTPDEAAGQARIMRDQLIASILMGGSLGTGAAFDLSRGGGALM